MIYTPRPYQHEALSVSVEKYKAGITKQLVAHATGLGKGFLLTKLSQYHSNNKRTMVMLHRDELATQLRDKFKKFSPNLSVGIEMGASYAKSSDEVVIASVPTIGREGSNRIKMFHPEDFGIIEIDEAHHATSAGNKRVFKHFDLLDTPTHKSESGILLFGTTATPNRSDEQGLGQIFDEIIHQKSIIEAINEGWLVNIRGIKVRTNTNISSVPVTAGDFSNGELSRAVNTRVRNYQIVQRWLDEAKQGSSYRQTVVFCASVEHAQQMSDAFNYHGVKSKAIWSGCTSRKQDLSEYEAGKYPVICNVGILTEGWDDPNTSCIILARPTQSQLVLIQQIGRGLRLPNGVDNLLEALKDKNYAGKRDCLVIDVVDNSTKNSLVTLSTLFGLPPAVNFNGQLVMDALSKVEKLEKERPQVDISTLTNISELEMESVDFFADKLLPEVKDNTKLKWSKVNNNEYQILLPNNEKVTVFHDLLADWTAVGTVKGTGFFQDGINSLQEAFRLADTFITMFGKDLLALLRREPSKAKPKPKSAIVLATELQKNYLKRLYKSNPKVLSQLNTITKTQASELMRSFTTGK